MRTPLTYYGGKQRLAGAIVSHLPAHRIYLEPFAGGAAVLFAKPRAERETLNDLDGTVMRFWRALRDRPDELAAAVAATPYGREEWRAADRARRAEPPDDDVEAARQLLVHLDQSFSRSGVSWSVPCLGEGRGRWQPGTWDNLPPKLLAAVSRLRGVALESADAVDMLPRWDQADALIYCDPPYAGEHRRVAGHGYLVEGTAKRSRYANGDTDELWDRLVEALAELERARVVLSGYPCEQADRLGWRSTPLRTRRTVQGRDGDALPLAPERLWFSPNVDANAMQLEVG